METKQLTAAATEAIAMTEKKINMPLDEIIKMSKKQSSKGRKPMRRPVKSRGSQNDNAFNRNVKVQRYMESRSSIRQAELSKRRSNFRANQFAVATEVAKKAAAMPFTNRIVNGNRTRYAMKPTQMKSAGGSSAGKDQLVAKQRPQTLDARFANIREQRMKLMSQQRMVGNGRQSAQQRMSRNGPQSAERRNVQQQQWNRAGAPATGRRFGNYGR